MDEIKTLWDLLDKHPVVIPKIQRDYAQGREKQISKLKSLLAKVIEKINAEDTYNLDYVYGAFCEDASGKKRFSVLDGQQRITTLWLLHWYISKRLGNTEQRLENFSYETRDSSTEFCNKICTKIKKLELSEDENAVSKYINNCKWFYKAWLRDPTIKAMLNAMDVIHHNYLKKKTDYELKAIWKGLTDDDKKFVRFDLLDIKKHISTEKIDDLYIKINARGKRLTAFENFKSAWFSHLEANNIKAAGSENYPYLADTDWLNYFWIKFNKNINLVDKCYFELINRLVMCNTKIYKELFDILNKFDKTTYKGCGTKERSSEELEKDKDKYVTFKEYERFIDEDFMIGLSSIFNAQKNNGKLLESIENCLKDLLDKFNEKADNSKEKADNYSFISDKHLGYNQAVYFYAEYRFLRWYDEADPLPDADVVEANLSDWLRVVRNIVVNSEISSFDTYKSCLEDVEEIAKMGNCCRDNIYEVIIKNADNKLFAKEDSMLKRQLKEEKEKAVLLQQGFAKETIHEAEDYSFFKGKICFLYKDEKNRFENEDVFQAKFNNAKTLFPDNNITPEIIKELLIRLGCFKNIAYLNLFITKGYTVEHGKMNFRDNILCGELTDAEKTSINDIKGNPSNEAAYLDNGNLKNKIKLKKTVRDMLMGTPSIYKLPEREPIKYEGSDKSKEYTYNYKRFVECIFDNNMLQKNDVDFVVFIPAYNYKTFCICAKKKKYRMNSMFIHEEFNVAYARLLDLEEIEITKEENNWLGDDAYCGQFHAKFTYKNKKLKFYMAVENGSYIIENENRERLRWDITSKNTLEEIKEEIKAFDLKAFLDKNFG